MMLDISCAGKRIAMRHNKTSKISIIIPVYNTEQYLKQCLDSVVKQTYPNLEIICVDDGSTDSSREILEQFARNDARFLVLTQPNSGQGAARNYGIEASSGEYITFLDADDWVDERFCEKLIHVIEEKAVDFVICAATVYDEKKKKYSNKTGYFNLRMFSDDSRARTLKDVGDRIFDLPVMPWGKVFRASFLKDGGVRFVPGYAFEDNGFFTDVLLSMKNFTIFKEPLVYYRVNRENSEIQSKGKNYIDVIFQLSYIKSTLEKYGLYNDYEEAYLENLFYILERKQSQIGDEYKETFYKKARGLVLSVAISPPLWARSVCIRENYMLYNSSEHYNEWRKINRSKGTILFSKKIYASHVAYCVFMIPFFKIYHGKKIKFFEVPNMWKKKLI